MEITGPDALEDALSRMYTTVRIARRPTSDPASVRLETATLGPLRFDQFTVDIGFEADVAPLGSMLIGRIRAGTATFDPRGAERCHGPGDVHLCAQPDAPYTQRSRGWRPASSCSTPAS